MSSDPQPRDPRSTFDYQGGEAAASPHLTALTSLIDGDIRFDEYTKELYATDASLYAVTPLGVAFPRHADDVARILGHCHDHTIPVLPRGAGTSLAGQAVNEAVVLDFSRHMDRLVDVDPDTQRCTVQPGIVLAELNDVLAEDELKFAPDPAWGDKSTIGGAIGNNSTGAHSLQYGKTDAYVESCEVVLADGTRTTFGECTRADIANNADPDGDLEARIYHCIDRLIAEESAAVMDAFPDIHRNVSGYNLDRLMVEAETGAVNVARLLAGSEGTLAIVTEATVRLEPIPPETGVALLLYEELQDGMQDVESVLAHDPAAVEIIDDVLLDLARETEEFRDIAGRLPAATEAALLVEFYADTPGEARQQIANLVTDRTADVPTRATPEPNVAQDVPVRASGAFEAEDAAERAQFWKLRKSGLPILLGRTSDAKHVSCIEDTAVPVEALADYVADVQAVLDEHGTFASFYAHAGPGCLHIRPLIDTHTVDGVETMVGIADAVTDLAVEYGGTVSGEHGDGRARTQWLEKQYGDTVVDLFRELKTAFDPEGILNPGQITGDVDMAAHLRISSKTEFDAPFEPRLDWDNDNGFRGMVELCHGCGGCRGEQHTTGGVMCPTYRAANEEITSTRGRANLLRQAMTGALPADEVQEPAFLAEVMDLCIGCKGCARDCPSEVDMARLKAEVTHAYHQSAGIDRRTKLFANIHRVAALGSATAPVSNWLPRLPGADWVAEQAFGIARERKLPTFARRTFLDRADPALDPSVADHEVVLLPDVMAMYQTPEIAMDALRVLEASGVAVTLPESYIPTGRIAYSMGCLDLAADRATTLVDRLTPALDRGATILTVEPSDTSMLRSDYGSLIDVDGVDALANNAYGVLEFLDKMDLDVPSGGGQTLTYHGHCHDKAENRANYAARVLEDAGWSVDILDSGCCGMAGSFGYEAEHYAMSEAIADILYRQVDASAGNRVIASGASCRTQLASHIGARPSHPIEVLAESLPSA